MSNNEDMRRVVVKWNSLIWLGEGARSLFENGQEALTKHMSSETRTQARTDEQQAGGSIQVQDCLAGAETKGVGGLVAGEDGA